MSKLFAIFGIDRAVAVTLLHRSWSIFGGLGTLFFVGRYLTPDTQGYYYTFNSLIALQVFVELGLNYAIIQFASHEMAELEWGPDSTLIGTEKAKSRLQSITKFAFAWFGVAALIVIAVLVPTGLIFFDIAASAEYGVEPRWPWVLLVVFTAILLVVNAALAILEGCNKVASVAAIRFVQSFFSVTAIWAALTNNLGIYALGIGSGIAAVFGFLAITFRYHRAFIDLWRHKSSISQLSWQQEIWPFQWRIAVSWVSGYMVFHLFSPFLFTFHGPKVAGQMGMSLQIISAMNSAALAWITTKAPLFGQFVARNDQLSLNKVFNAALIKSFLVLVLAIFAVFGTLVWLTIHFPKYAERVVEPRYFAVLCLICLANHIVFAQAAYLRAHKQEPFMWLSVIIGLITSALAVHLIPKWSISGAIIAYAIGSLVIGLFGGSYVFSQFKVKRRVTEKICIKPKLT